MSTGLTFGSISALYELSHGIIDQAKYSILVSAVIASAVVPTIIAKFWFQPRETGPRPRARGVYPGTAEHFLHTPEE
jgi:hypothetical protein